MDCREAKKKLVKLADGLLAADGESALREHLKECPGCARLALAEQMLARDIEQIRGEHAPRPITIEQVREGIAFREKHYKDTSLGVRIMRQVSDTVYRKPRLSLAAATLFILLLASILVPVRTEYPVGYEVAFASPGSGLRLNQENAEIILAALDIDETRIEVIKGDSGTEYRIAPLKDSIKVRKLVAVLDSLGGKQVRSTVAKVRPRERTIWQLLLDDTEPEIISSAQADRTERRILNVDINLGETFKDNIILWLPVGDQSGDSLNGLLMDKKGDRTNIQILGGISGMSVDECGWHQFLNNSIMNTETPDGKKATFNLCDIKDVRKLEKMGYNFVTMKWDTPGQIPIPGMGPKLNEIEYGSDGRMIIIEYMIPQVYEVQLQILDTQGRVIRNLLRSEPCSCMPPAGIRQVTWDGLDADGNRAQPGTYLCRFTAGDYVETQRIRLEH